MQRGTPDPRRDRRAQRRAPRPRAHRPRRGEHRRGDGDARRAARGRRRHRGRRRGQHRRAAAAVSSVGGIVVGETTYRATKDLFEYEPLEPVTVKGKAESLPLWHAMAPRRRFGVDVEPIVHTPLIGRDDDLALLQSIYTRTLRDASVQLVTVTGEPGVGKTRLLAEFRSWVDDRPELVFWRQGRSPSLRRGHHVLGAGRDGEGAGGNPRVRHA